MSAKKTAKDSAETFAYYIGGGFDIAQQFAKPRFDIVYL